MIKKIRCIKNIGKFLNFSSNADELSFQRETIIYGRNANGKSTLSAIFRSLKKGDPSILYPRRAFGAGENSKEVIIEEDSKNYIFRNKKWNDNEQLAEIEIFDSKFISENIFDGESVQGEHKQRLHKIILGEKGNTLARDIETLKGNLSTAEQEKSDLKRNFQIQFPGEDPDSFCAINDSISEEDLSKLITDKETEITNNENQSSIIQIQNIPEVQIQNLDFKNIKTTLSQNLVSTAESSKQKVIEHVQANWNDSLASKNFLKDGLGLLKEKDFLGKRNCVFCGQDLQNVEELISAYQNFFDEIYENLKKEIDEKMKKFQEWNVDLFFKSIEGEFQKVFSQKEKWEGYLGETEIERIDDNLLEAKDIFDAQKLFFISELEKKKRDLAYEINFESLNNIEKAWSNLKKILEDKNLKIREHNQKIEEFKKRLLDRNLQLLKEELRNLKKRKLRKEKQWEDFCEKWKTVNGAVVQLKQQIVTKGEEIETETTRIFSQYGKSVNGFFDYLHADFKLKELTPKKPHHRDRSSFYSCEFTLSFFGNDEYERDFNEDTIKNTLSESDRRLLAFAFFLALLSQDENLDKKIIVFDDPISSFDEERKRKSILALKNLKSGSKEPAQKIIFTHEKNFFAKLHRQFPDARFLKIESSGDSSVLMSCDVEGEFLKPQEIKDLEEIERYSNSSVAIPSDAHKNCRKILEHIMRRKYYFELKDFPISSITTFSQKLQELNIYESGFVQEISELNLHLPHHSPAREEVDELSDGDIKSTLKDFLGILKKI